jgi:hypothetical protein
VRLSLDLCTLDEVQPLNSVRLSSNLCALDEVELYKCETEFGHANMHRIHWCPRGFIKENEYM